MSYLWLALAWAAWAAFHSLTICRACQARIEAHWPGLAPYYRLTYSLVSLVSLIPPVWLYLVIDGGPLVIDWPWWLNGLLGLAGLALAWAAYRAEAPAFAPWKKLAAPFRRPFRRAG